MGESGNHRRATEAPVGLEGAASEAPDTRPQRQDKTAPFLGLGMRPAEAER